MLASCAYALVFLVVGRRYPSALHFRYWIASSAMYAVILVGFGCLPRPAGATIDALMYGALAVTDVLIVMGVRVFEGEKAFRPWMVALVAATMALKAGSVVLATSGWAVSPFAALVVDAIILSLAIGITGLVIYRGHDTPMRRIAGAAMMAYVPGYALALVGEWAMPGERWLARAPLMLDQLLLAVMNLGLLAMCGERAQQALRDAARLDPLTQLLNRAGLRVQEKTLVRPGTGVVAFDIDHFKAVNDRHGHAVGDEVLVELAHAARRLAAVQGGLVVRLGGDEFAAVMPGSGIEGARLFATQLTDAVMASGERAELPVWTVSLGIALVAADDVALAPALGRADALLYSAKRGGRNRMAAWTARGVEAPDMRAVPYPGAVPVDLVAASR
ncbi:sensor domain-containing diguanylate cyclase [Sphingomonas mollis]|uniref:diguanylate cyclase n=1 Tax=Sphingomonas mollis TaxID=2795726 RepID=A0ABS0XQC3_9SPHN|nr:GGDEF domain-containing protein [Sphingomonas sp. BT553]MBJ6121938.1 GGDEF domain-containing protein [Sphingomonas sp. BT553]